MSPSPSECRDVVGIGAGPFNLGLAALADPVSDLDVLLLEARDDVSWHPGMLLPEATLQVPFLADVVTMADPTSPWSFLNYLKQNGHLYSFYIREEFQPLRREYDDYLRWVAAHLIDRDALRLGHRATGVEHDGSSYLVQVHTADGDVVIRARRVVLGVGTAPFVPPALRPLVENESADTFATVVHSADYLDQRERLRIAAQRTGSVTVVGSGQSAAEIYADLIEGTNDRGYDVHWVTRSPRYFPMEYTKLTLEMTSPEYTEYFQSLPSPTRTELLESQRSLYKGISSQTINAIFDTLYARRVNGSRGDSTLLTASEVTGAERVLGPGGELVTLLLRHQEKEQEFALATGAVVLATGYQSGVPEVLDGVRDRLCLDAHGRLAVSCDYACDVSDREIFVQNAEEHTHGFVAPDLGMGAWRNSILLRALTGREVYPIEKRVAFQEFGVPDRLRGTR